MAAKAEAQNTKVSFDYDDGSYTIAPTKEWSLDVLEAIEDEKIVAALRAILGADQWLLFKSKPRKVEDLNALFEAISKASGLQGNS